MKRVMALCLTAALLIGSVAAAEVPDEAYYLYVFCDPESYVNIREFAKKGSTVFGELKCGDRVLSCGKKKRGFVLVYLDGFEISEGWIYSPYLSAYPPVIPEEPEAYRIREKSRVASWKCIGGERQAWLQPKETVTVTATAGEWALTDRGYVRLKYLEKAVE